MSGERFCALSYLALPPAARLRRSSSSGEMGALVLRSSSWTNARAMEVGKGNGGLAETRREKANVKSMEGGAVLAFIDGVNSIYFENMSDLTVRRNGKQQKHRARNWDVVFRAAHTIPDIFRTRCSPRW